MNPARNFKQSATYWAATGKNAYGKLTFAAPASIMVRWEDSVEEMIDNKGQTRVSKARVFVPIDVADDSFLFLGTSSAVDPTTVDKAFRVIAVSKTTDLRGLANLKTVYL